MSERDEFDSFQYFIEFTVTVSSSNLNNYFYSEHQQYLYDTIKELHGKGLGYRKISNELNHHNIKSPQGKKFYPSLVQSIWKKIVSREKVMSKPVVSEYRDFDIGFGVRY